ncbi:MAG: AMP-binding protein [Alphaproteobacteria bacterium]|nr:AMP-binding protein [Alphaproteobacteria bacterium]
MIAMLPSGHVDSFARDNLPPADQWPELVFDRAPGLVYPDRLNAAVEFVDRWIERGQGGRIALKSAAAHWSYALLAERIDRIAGVLVDDMGFVPGNRVLLRGPNNPMMAACCLAVWKAGGIAVNTMPLLRARELDYIVEKARIRFALCDARFGADMESVRSRSAVLERVVSFNAGGAPDSLEALMATGPAGFTACDTAADDVALVAFTSGTTGPAKGTMHFHRDLLAICDTTPRHVIMPSVDDVFIGSPPFAFTFGLGVNLLFPLRMGASAALVEHPSPPNLLAAIAQNRATILSTAPTAYRAMLDLLKGADIATLRKCVSAGEHLPLATFEAWKKATGIAIIDGIGATEMLHIFIAASGNDIRPGSTGRAVPGYEARVVDDNGHEMPPGQIGRLAVRGPTGCRYLADERQKAYVRDGWNFTGDAYARDADGYFWYAARTDDMIVSAGYNISGPEVEGVLLDHPKVRECGVVAAPDEERGAIVKAYVVLRDRADATERTVKELQDFAKREIAPYKYPRAIEFVDALPRTETGKLQRFKLRLMASQARQ